MPIMLGVSVSWKIIGVIALLVIALVRVWLEDVSSNRAPKVSALSALLGAGKTILDAVLVFILVALALEVPHFREVLRTELKGIVWENLDDPKAMVQEFSPDKIRSLKYAAFGAERPDTTLPEEITTPIDLFSSWMRGNVRVGVEIHRKIDEVNGLWRITQTDVVTFLQPVHKMPPLINTLRAVRLPKGDPLFSLAELTVNETRIVPCVTRQDSSYTDHLGRKLVRFVSEPTSPQAVPFDIRKLKIVRELWVPVGDPWIVWMQGPTQELNVRIEAKEALLKNLEFWRADPSDLGKEALLPGTPIVEHGSVAGVKTYAWPYDKYLFPGHSFMVLWRP